MQEELRRVEAIGASILVLHPGAHVKAGVEVGMEWIVNGLNQVLDQDDSNVVIALETMAGKGSEIGSNFEELAKIREQIHKKSGSKFVWIHVIFMTRAMILPLLTRCSTSLIRS